VADAKCPRTLCSREEFEKRHKAVKPGARKNIRCGGVLHEELHLEIGQVGSG
jgi:hypothetical protein